MPNTLAEIFSPQNRRLITLKTALCGEQELLLDSFTGREALSELFTYELELLALDAHIELKSLIGTTAQLQVELADGGARVIDGCISRFSMISSDGGLCRYSATLSPWVWLLSQRQDSRIFQEKTVEETLRAVFAAYGAVACFEFRLFHELKPHSYITQYFESDLDFILRVLEHEGLLFYFEHDADGHRLVVTDRSRELTELPEQPRIRYHRASVTETEDAITRWSAHRHLQSTRISLQTNDYKQPANALPVSMNSLNRQGDVLPLEIYDRTQPYSHGDYLAGEALLRRRIEAHESTGKSFTGASNCRSLRAGFTFELTEHFDHDQDTREERQFLLLSVEHEGRNNYRSANPAEYSNTFSCIRRTIPFRPMLTVPRPVISGPLTAVVVGPETEEVFTDELGRVRVRFHWQRRVETPDKAVREDAEDTAWLRVAMPSAGTGFGHQFVPRIGQEVLVQHVAGDVDRPVVTGVMYNGTHAHPYFSGEPGLPGNKALSGIKSREHSGRGYNELLFDDTSGELRTRLASTQHATALNMGKLTTPRVRGSASPRGEGAELRTDAAIALRAAQGMLLTTYARTQANGAQLDRRELLDLLAECGELFKALGQTAGAQGSQPVDERGFDGLQQSLRQWPEPDSAQSGDPVLAMAAVAGTVSATPASHLQVAGENHDTLARRHVQVTSGQATRINAGQGIALFAEDHGISAIANRGAVRVQAQNADIALTAQQNVQISAQQGEVVISAPSLRFVADDGSYIRIGGGIEMGTQAKVVTHASAYHWVGPKTDRASVAMPPPGDPICLKCLLKAALSGAAEVTL
ncbi:type VI secretion system Vgr family protein [Pseudomonas sp.]|uniref:type VI secretion system Vgr family protein n=1 Tax=Pseudomonas sp. TaxID=306 RepID=UPI002ED85C83